jgi:hypothetical protein
VLFHVCTCRPSLGTQINRYLFSKMSTGPVGAKLAGVEAAQIRRRIPSPKLARWQKPKLSQSEIAVFMPHRKAVLIMKSGSRTIKVKVFPSIELERHFMLCDLASDFEPKPNQLFISSYGFSKTCQIVWLSAVWHSGCYTRGRLANFMAVA